MDRTAILYLSDTELIELGIARKGDLFAVRSFCEQWEKQIERQGIEDDREHRKQFLIQKLRLKRLKTSGASGSRHSNSQVTPERNCKTRKFQIGWLHYAPDKSKYLAVRQATGGGTRNLAMPANSTMKDLLMKCGNYSSPIVLQNLVNGKIWLVI